MNREKRRRAINTGVIIGVIGILLTIVIYIISTDPRFEISTNTTKGTVEQGEEITVPVHIKNIKVIGIEKYSKEIALDADNLPENATVSFEPDSRKATFDSLMTIKTSSETPEGKYVIEIKGTGTDTATDSYLYTLTVKPTKSFKISLVPNEGTIRMGEGIQGSLTVEGALGYDKSVDLTASVEGDPAGILISFSNPTGSPTYSSTMNVTTSADTPKGSYIVTVNAMGEDGKELSCVYTLNVTDTGEIVVVTKTGEKYHRPDCYHVKGKTGTRTIPKDQAVAEGYEPCEDCNP